MSRAWILAGVAGALVVGASCEPWDPEPPVQTFALLGAHTTLTCEQCHGPPPFGPLGTRCDACHEPDRKPCAAGAQPPCHYEDQVDPLTSLRKDCSASGCHAATDLTWSDVGGGGCPTPPDNHDFFPLEGFHAGPGCSECHTSGDAECDDLYGDVCMTCHEDDRFFGTHYVEDAADWPAGTELGWDCAPCHTASDAQPAWEEYELHPPDAINQGDSFKVPHGTADDAPLPAAPPALGVAITDPGLWVSACLECHPGEPTEYATLSCADGCHAEIFAVGDHYGNSAGNVDELSCLDAGCHPDGRLDVGQAPLP